MWKGPYVDGITQSLLNEFLKCPYSFYIYTILGLKEPEQPQPNLIWGDCFHKGLELLIPESNLKVAVEGMVEYLHTNYPFAPNTFELSLKKMLRIYSTKPFKGDWRTEEVIDTYMTLPQLPHKVRIRGKKDAITHNHPEFGSVLGEHKAKGYTDPEQTRDEIQQDLQCNLYMYTEASPCEWVFYDLIKIPDVQKYGPQPYISEPSEKYIERIYSGPMDTSYGGKYPIYKYKHLWINQGVYHIPLSSQEEYWDTVISPQIRRLAIWYDYVTDPNFDYQNPSHYNEFFYKMPVRHFDGRKTENFKCKYHSLLTNQSTIDDLVPVNSYFSELE
jgi:hypothetical protein